MTERADLAGNQDQAVFVVKVQFCQNATWQGTISWADQKKTQRFRSTLEMIRLMDEALAQEQNEIPDSWDSEEEGAAAL